MGKGILTGLIWGTLASVLVLVVTSVVAPPPSTGRTAEGLPSVTPDETAAPAQVAEEARPATSGDDADVVVAETVDASPEEEAAVDLTEGDAGPPTVAPAPELQEAEAEEAEVAVSSPAREASETPAEATAETSPTPSRPVEPTETLTEETAVAAQPSDAGAIVEGPTETPAPGMEAEAIAEAPPAPLDTVGLSPAGPETGLEPSEVADRPRIAEAPAETVEAPEAGTVEAGTVETGLAGVATAPRDVGVADPGAAGEAARAETAEATAASPSSQEPVVADTFEPALPASVAPDAADPVAADLPSEALATAEGAEVGAGVSEEAEVLQPLADAALSEPDRIDAASDEAAPEAAAAVTPVDTEIAAVETAVEESATAVLGSPAAEAAPDATQLETADTAAPASRSAPVEIDAVEARDGAAVAGDVLALLEVDETDLVEDDSVSDGPRLALTLPEIAPDAGESLGASPVIGEAGLPPVAAAAEPGVPSFEVAALAQPGIVPAAPVPVSVEGLPVPRAAVGRPSPLAEGAAPVALAVAGRAASLEIGQRSGPPLLPVAPLTEGAEADLALAIPASPPAPSASAEVLPSPEEVAEPDAVDSPAEEAPSAPAGTAPADADGDTDGAEIAQADPPTVRPSGLNNRVAPLTERAPSGGTGVRVRRPPGFTGETGAGLPGGTAAAEPQDVPAPSAGGVAADGPALARNARPFDAPEGVPLLAVVLVDPGTDGAAPSLMGLPFPVSLAVDPAAEGAAETAAIHAEAGQEVLLYGTALPQGAAPQDAEVTLAAYFAAMPSGLAVLERPEAGLMADPRLGAQVMEILRDEGLGLLLWDRGLNRSLAAAARESVPAALVARRIDDGGAGPGAIARALDRAAFEAGRTAAAVVVGSARQETIEALGAWAAGTRAAQVALAPVSAVLIEDQEGS